MTELFLVRHAEAEGNLYRRCHGHYDSRLTPNGEKQVSALRERFESINFDAVYSSDLYRARTTAAALRPKSGVSPRILPGLREVFLGRWEDQTWGEIARNDPARYESFTVRPWQFSAPGSEATGALLLRARTVLQTIADAHPDSRVGVVSHGMFIRALTASLEGYPPEEMTRVPHCDNTAVAKIEYENGAFRVVFRGDNSHLGELSTLQKQNWWRESGAQKDAHLWFRPVKFPRDNALWTDCRRDAWISVYGSLGGFAERPFWMRAREMARAHPRAVVFAMLGEEPVGLIELDTEIVLPGGHIALFYLRPDCRDRGLGAQLMGHAVSVYRALGVRGLHLRVAPQNLRARRFYEKLGFVCTGQEEGSLGPLLIMQADIVVPPLNEVPYALF